MTRKYIDDGNIGPAVVIDFGVRASSLLFLALLPAVYWGRGNQLIRWLLIGLLAPALWLAFLGFVGLSDDPGGSLPPIVTALYLVFFTPAALILWALFWPQRKA